MSSYPASTVTSAEVPVLRAEGPYGIQVAFTGRHGGVSRTPFDSLNLAARVGDDRAAVTTNRARVAEAAGFDIDRLALARQIHGRDALEVGPGDAGVLGEADVLVTAVPGSVLGILTADCAPVVVVARDKVAIAHAGWRGLVAGAIEAAAERVGEPEAAWVGPCIKACCYEVGSEVIQAFEGAGLPVVDGSHVDPQQAALAILARLAVPHVWAADVCTSCSHDYFSYRRDGVTGRQGAFVWM